MYNTERLPSAHPQNWQICTWLATRQCQPIAALTRHRSALEAEYQTVADRARPPSGRLGSGSTTEKIILGGRSGCKTQLASARRSLRQLAGATVWPAQSVCGAYRDLLAVHDKEKVYGSIPYGGSRSEAGFERSEQAGGAKDGAIRFTFARVPGRHRPTPRNSRPLESVDVQSGP